MRSVGSQDFRQVPTHIKGCQLTPILKLGRATLSQSLRSFNDILFVKKSPFLKGTSLMDNISTPARLTNKQKKEVNVLNDSTWSDPQQHNRSPDTRSSVRRLHCHDKQKEDENNTKAQPHTHAHPSTMSARTACKLSWNCAQKAATRYQNNHTKKWEWGCRKKENRDSF